FSEQYEKLKKEIDSKISNFDENKISEDKIKAAIEKLGYECENCEITDSEQNKEDLIKQREDLKEMFLNEEIFSEQYEKLKKEIDSKISKLEEAEENETSETIPEEDDEEPENNLKKDLVINERISEKKSKHKKIENDSKKNIIMQNNSEDDRFSAATWILIIVSIALFLFLLYYFNLIQIPGIKIPEIALPQAGDKFGLGLIFLIGILTGFHCVSMCGSFVVSYTAKNALNGHKSYKQHLVYGGAKVISYTIMGGIFGLIGGIIAFSVGLRAGVAIFTGVFMIFYALSMFGLKFFRRFQFNPKFLTRFTMKASANAKGPYKGPMVTGLLNGLFIACGPLQAMYLYAAGTGSFTSGATALAVFGLGTLPIMIGFGSFATVISHKTTQKILKISGIIVLILGLIMLNRGLTMIGSPYSFSAIQSKIVGTSVVASGTGAVLNNGIQEVNMNVDASGYSPNSFVLKKGVLVKWNVNVKQLTGCNSELILNQYGISKNLKQGLNVIEFTPDKDGTISFSCGMGMLRGSFIVTETGTATQQEVTAATPAKGMQCGGSGGGGCGCGG
ncbi:MAG: sulfite exporter TauE/SafE family protein, partial [Nanoarchaeota archaeon]